VKSKAQQDSSFFKVISDEAIMAILAIQPDGKCVYANRLAHDLFEFPIGFDVETFSINELFVTNSNENKMHKFSKETLEMQGLIQEVLIKKLSGQMFIATLGIKKINNFGESQILIMAQDITVQKKLQREVAEKQMAIHQAYEDLLIQNKQLKELDTAKNRFIAMTTHELRTPLSAVVASSEILVNKLYDSPTQQDEFIEMIHDQGKHLLNLVNDILDFAKLQSNKMDYYIEQNSLAYFVEQEVASFQLIAQSAKIQLTFQQHTTDAQCYFDELRLRQVFANLVNNAIKYNRPMGSVSVYLKETQDEVQVYVSDTGKGISKSDHEKVFNEFETLGKVSNHSKGTGLGLSISQKMIQSMGGKITLESEEGVGSTFSFNVPKTKVLSADNYRKRPDDDSDSGDLAA
jgi:PAS domain S-box-containing protein